jgi:hypothetical protein
VKAETIPLLSREREAELRGVAEARAQQQVQQMWAALTDEYHHEIRKAADQWGRKTIAWDLGVDLSTVSNWLSCENGRGFPPPRLMLYLRDKVPTLAAWENDHAGYLPPQLKMSAIDGGQAISEIERDVLPELGKRDADKVRSILRRVRGAR